MFGLGPHWGFILAAYAVATLVLAGVVVWVVADLKAQRRILADLESRGIRRRSDGGTAGPGGAA